MLPKQGVAGRLDSDYIAVGDVEHQVEVVNHQIKHNTHIGAAA